MRAFWWWLRWTHWKNHSKNIKNVLIFQIQWKYTVFLKIRSTFFTIFIHATRSKYISQTHFFTLHQMHTSSRAYVKEKNEKSWLDFQENSIFIGFGKARHFWNSSSDLLISVIIKRLSKLFLFENITLLFFE